MARSFKLIFPKSHHHCHHLNGEKASSMKRLSTLHTKESQLLESMLTIPQVAEILSVSHATVFRLIKYEGLPVTKMGHTTRVPRNKLYAWLEEHTA